MSCVPNKTYLYHKNYKFQLISCREFSSTDEREMQWTGASESCFVKIFTVIVQHISNGQEISVHGAVDKHVSAVSSRSPELD